MAAKFRIHPAIGIARLGNSQTSFYIAPDQAGELPIDCDQNGNPIVKNGREQPIKKFKDDKGAIRRQAARFRAFVYDDASPQGREVAIGDTYQILNQRSGQLLTVRIDDVRWTVYLANKKSSWYEFQETAGEHGYSASHKLRNADVTDAQERQQLIIDPGPRSVHYGKNQKGRRATFTAGNGPTSFPPPLSPNAITSLGELIATQQDKNARLLVLGGFGNSGSMLSGFGNPKIEAYANNDGWFDDIADGPVSARLVYTLLKINDQDAPKPDPKAPPPSFAVDDPAWVIVGYPRYVPEIVDIVTMDDLVFDLSVRNFGYVPYMFGIPPFDGRGHAPKSPDELAFWRRNAQWNRDYRPYFYRDIWPILQRPYNYLYLMDKDPLTGGNPHNTEPGGNFDESVLSVAPYEGEDPHEREERRQKRQFIYKALRQPGQENDLLSPDYAADPEQLHRMPAAENVTPQNIDPDRLFLMPLLCGDNPLSNTVPSKFFRLTDTMLFLLGQWADGKFINEQREDIAPPPQPPEPGAQLDRGALAGALGGAFCPGGEACWIMRNPAIYSAPYRIHASASVTPGGLSQPPVVANAAPFAVTAASIADGLEPGDITKYSAVPWQSDFNECTNQAIDITYRGWNNIEPDTTGDSVTPITQLTYWWPVHRPNWVNGVPWSPTAQNNAGDLQMVTAWATLGFIRSDPNQGFVVTEDGSR